MLPKITPKIDLVILGSDSRDFNVGISPRPIWASRLMTILCYGEIDFFWQNQGGSLMTFVVVSRKFRVQLSTLGKSRSTREYLLCEARNLLYLWLSSHLTIPPLDRPQWKNQDQWRRSSWLHILVRWAREGHVVACCMHWGEGKDTKGCWALNYVRDDRSIM